MPAPAMPMMPPMPNDDDDDDGDQSGGPLTINPGEVDANGFPWDERIHAKSKGKNSDGTWRMKRGVAEATVQAVQSELRSTAAPLVPVPLTAAPMPPATLPPIPGMPPVGLPVMPSISIAAPPQMISSPAPVPVPAPVAPPPPPEPTPVALDFNGFMAHLTSLMQGGQVTMEYLQSKIAAFNGAWAAQPGFQPINAVTDLATDPAKLNYMVQLFTMDGKW